jgi:hypothetical protein
MHGQKSPASGELSLVLAQMQEEDGLKTKAARAFFFNTAW